MDKFITGLRYGTWATRLYVLAIPVAFLAGIGVIIAAFVTNVIWMFLVGVVLLIGGVALILNYNIDVNDTQDQTQKESEDTQEQKAVTENRPVRHGDLVVGAVDAPKRDSQKTMSEDIVSPDEEPDMESEPDMEAEESKKQEWMELSGTDETAIEAGSADIDEDTPEAADTPTKKKRAKQKKDRREKDKQAKDKPSFWERLFRKKQITEDTEEDQPDEESAPERPKKKQKKTAVPKAEKSDRMTEEDMNEDSETEEIDHLPEDEKDIEGKTKNKKPKKKKEKSGKEIDENEPDEEEDQAGEDGPETEPEDKPAKEKKEKSKEEHDEDELMEYNEVVMKQVFYKYKVKRDHKTIMIDTWEEKGIKQLPAYMWVTKGQVHILTIGQEVGQYTIPMSKTGSLYYKKGVICQAKEEYLQFRKESMLGTVFSPYLPTYHEGNKNHRPVLYKNLFALENGLTVTNTSAKTVISMLNPRLEVDDIVMRDVRFNDYFKEIYKLGLLFREQIYSVKEYQAKVNDVLRRYVTSGVGQEEYENTLQSLYQHKLITEEYIMFYMQYYDRIRMEELEQGSGKKARKKKKV